MFTLEYDFRSYADDAGRTLKRVGKVDVATLSEAVEEHDRLMSEVGCGASGHRKADLLQSGDLIGTISPNGRIWCNCEEDTLHEMCRVPPYNSLPRGATEDFLVPAPKHIRTIAR